MTNNQTAFQRFAELLDIKQKEFDSDRDIRDYVLSASQKPVAFSYVRKNIESNFGSNLPMIFPRITAVDEPDVGDCALHFVSGTIYRDDQYSHKGAVKIFNNIPETAEIILFEAGFLATTHSWSHSFREGKPEYACLGYVYDDIAHYFMADYPNRIIQKLNSEEQPSTEELTRARGLIQRIVERRISKYNAQPMHAPAMTEGYTRRVLVCDQAFADASTIYGKADEAAFEKMLVAAIQENPDAEILVKTHPDSSWEKSKRSGYYSHLSSSGRVRLLREPVNPYCIFDLVDKVYVGTSQMGLEALFAGKEVVCFGAPFYAGWGLTDDRQKIPHRHRQRSLEELFHYFYIWYTIYHVPECEAPSQIEDALDYIEAHRPYTLPPTEVEAASPPRVSIIIPVYGVEDYIEECLTSIQNQSLREIEIIPVNDCSPDGSQAIIDRLAAQDPRIRPIVLSENVGQGFARNRGIEASQGEYIWFIDADDWLVDPVFLEKIITAADKNNADMTRAKKAGEAVFDKNDELIRVIEDKSEAFFTTNISKTNFKNSPEILQNRHFWMWLYRRTFLKDNNIHFVTTQWEERAFLLKALLSARHLTLTTNLGTMYRIRQNSTARRSKNMKDVENFTRNIEQIATLLKEHGAADPASEYREHLKFQISQFIHFSFFGFFYSTLIRECENPEVYLERLAKALESLDFLATDISRTPINISKKFLSLGVYQLATSALLARHFDLLAIAANRQPVQQDQLYDFQLAEPENARIANLQNALSTYARNEQVTTLTHKASSITKKARIVIHIGATKTGSTYLQHYLEKNRPALLRAGVWFPEVGLFWQPTRPHKQAGHSDVIQAAVNNQPDVLRHIEAGLTLMSGKIHTVVLSSEAFFLNEKAHRIAEYFAGYPVEMVAYLRRQDEWANAQYCEFVAGGAVGRVDIPFSEWLKRPETRRLLDYRIPLSAWADAIGQENVKVRVFEKERLHDNDLLADFAKTINLPALLDLPEPPEDDRNSARLSTAHVELIRLFNSRPFRDRNAYFDFIEEVTQGLQRWRTKRGLAMPKPWVLSDQLAAEIMDDVRYINQEVATTYFKGNEGPLFGSAAPRPETTGIYPEEIVLIADAYERAKPLDTAPSQSERLVMSSQTSLASLKIVNYGLFGWRYWLLTPLLALLFAKRATPELQREFLKEPAQFARKNWSQRRPVMTKLLYPDTDPMGPFQVFRIWVRLMSKVARLSGRAHLSKAIEDDPIRFARTMHNPVRRFIGRLMFPCGELR
ncbi:Capsule polysaccharide modification protein LipA [Alloalcanivorax dieselolei B5]|uniref:Capsule polysaccharide modification protein LipA n=1 Tax=Alcanivorax dieselolei (strain DSM 16502 / CGMCC 1.3690 / MCCC 1A00001 / B-5) TaxID=930169 RepID=K0CC11_ALCDB|nr:glycosyltransferase [Alloalcanivorax dieselolei]AFT70035.1 Capsule polysaccharide modification protein LipA [Alloalcanivorax dieselolei B5]GGK09116.1 hypothetical protein GCM10007426_41690 [Alloalcanivorax dieselolei]